LAVGSGILGADMAKSHESFDYSSSVYDSGSYDDGAYDSGFCDDTLAFELTEVRTDGTNLFYSVVIYADACMDGASIGSYQEIGITWFSDGEERSCTGTYTLRDPTLEGGNNQFNFTLRNCAPTVGATATLNWAGGTGGTESETTVRSGTVSIDDDSATTTTWDSSPDDNASGGDGSNNGSDFPSATAPDSGSGSGSGSAGVDDGAEDTAGSDLGPSVTFADQQQQAAASVIERFVQAYDEGDVATIRAIDPSKDDETVAELELPDAAAIQILGTSDFSETSPTTGASGYLVHGLYVVQKGSCEERYDVWWLVDEETDTVVQEHGIDGYKNTAIKEC
jgi:hypothetical protein